MSKFPLIQNVDFAQMGHSEPKRTQGGAGIAIVYSSRAKSDRTSLVFQLIKPEPVLMDDAAAPRDRDNALSALPYVRTSFHLQPDPKFEVKDGKHTIYFALSAELAAYVRQLDEANITEVVANAKDWFKRGNLSAELVRANYNSILTRYPNNPEVAENDKVDCVRVKVIEGKTEILVQNGTRYKSFHRGDIKDLRRNARVVPVFQDNGIYFRSTESGGQLMAVRILVMHGDADVQNMDFDMGDIQIEIEDNFEVPAANAAPVAANVEEPNCTTQTVVDGKTWGPTAEYTGPAVVF